MPLIEQSTYRPPRWLKNKQHLQTIIPSAFRKVSGVDYVRERLELPDGDFLDLDWSFAANTILPKPPDSARPLVILSHGLEGSSERTYMLGMVRTFNQKGYDALAWNLRGCSGEPNRLERFYHHGATDDLKAVIDYVLALGRYHEIVLVGFSLGGNLVLKYLGEQAESTPNAIKKAVAMSAPCDLLSSAPLLSNGLMSRFYARRFKNKLLAKVKAKAQKGIISAEKANRLLAINSLEELTETYVAPLHGFVDAEDYYIKNSSMYYLENIRVPTLLFNASNDPMLSEGCSPTSTCRQSSYVFLEVTPEGGHCGFLPDKLMDGWMYWSEWRTLQFVLEME
ncbi:MAG: alpha/beta fold hydrolase [Spirosomataceae bacterium]